MKYKLITVFCLAFYTCSSQAGVGKIVLEILEAITSKSVKHVADVPSTVIIPTDVVVVQTTRPVRVLAKELSSYDPDSVEYKITNLIADDLEVCNSFDIKKYINFIKSSVHGESPIKEVLQSTESLEYFQRYRKSCHVDSIKFLGNGLSIDEINKFAYVEISGDISISGLMGATFKNIETFRLDGNHWKVWNTVSIEMNAQVLEQNWWVYDNDKMECLLNAGLEDGFFQPLTLLENFKQLNCTTEGLKQEILLVSCKNKDLEQNNNYVYFSAKNKCKKFWESIRQYRAKSP